MALTALKRNRHTGKRQSNLRLRWFLSRQLTLSRLPLTDMVGQLAWYISTSNVSTRSLSGQVLPGCISSYCKKTIRTDWCRLEASTKANKTGLWSHANPIPPWEYRHVKPRSSHADYTRQADTQSIAYHRNVRPSSNKSYTVNSIV